MRRDIGTSGAWLAGAGITAICGYLIATVAAGGRHPDWPYLLFCVLTVVGIGLYAMGRSSGRASRDFRSVKVQAIALSGNREPAGGKFTELADGTTIHNGDRVSGIVTSRPSGAEPWLLVRSIGYGRFVRQDRLFLDMHNQFRATVHLDGLLYGEEYLLLLVLAQPNAIRPNDFGISGIEILPPEVRILDQRTVMLARV